MSSLARLAENLPRIDPASADLAQALKEALNYPGDAAVYALNGQPVITYWGHIDPHAAPADRVTIPTGADVPEGKSRITPAGIRSRLTPLRIALAVLALSAGGLWFLISVGVPELFDGVRSDCVQLRSWEHTFGGRLASWFGLAHIQKQLHTGLYRCMVNDLQAEFRQRLAAADGDCAQLAELEQPLTEQARTVPELNGIKDALGRRLQECAKRALIADFQQRLIAALGHCEQLRALRLPLVAKSQSVPELTGLVVKLDEALKPCIEDEIVASFEQRLAAAAGSCSRLQALQQPLAEKSRSIPALLPLQNRLDASLRSCETTRLLADFEKYFAAARGDCRRLNALKRPLAEKRRSVPELKSLSNRLDAAIRTCAKKKITRAPKLPRQAKTTVPTASARQPSVDPAKLCPGERPKELAPQVVLVFDASGSMGKPIAQDADSEQILEQLVRGLPVFGDVFRGMERLRRPEFTRRRIDAAKQAAGKVIAELPADIDIGLVVLRDCPAATKVGFYPPAQRRRLQRQIAAIHPLGGTPLGDAVAKAGEMINGVDRQALMVVISDGQESCGVNPCAIGRRISRVKPKLTINVVDILGTGAGTCLAQVTGGRVFTAQNANEIKTMVKRAAADVQVPAHCRH